MEDREQAVSQRFLLSVILGIVISLFITMVVISSAFWLGISSLSRKNIEYMKASQQEILTEVVGNNNKIIHELQGMSSDIQGMRSDIQQIGKLLNEKQ